MENIRIINANVIRVKRIQWMPIRAFGGEFEQEGALYDVIGVHPMGNVQITWNSRERDGHPYACWFRGEMVDFSDSLKNAQDTLQGFLQIKLMSFVE